MTARRGPEAFLHFYPRPPRGGRPPHGPGAAAHPYFYPRPPRGGRPSGCNLRCSYCYISIHALREEGDRLAAPLPALSILHFYPRPPRGGRRRRPTHSSWPSRFLSTPSARRATLSHLQIAVFSQFLSTPSARRATQTGQPQPKEPRFLSTPSARRATYRTVSYNASIKFLSTPSARRATVGVDLLGEGGTISIHALREEGDCRYRSGRYGTLYFYPRPPRGGRRQYGKRHSQQQDFYPRPPRGGRLSFIGCPNGI